MRSALTVPVLTACMVACGASGKSPSAGPPASATATASPAVSSSSPTAGPAGGSSLLNPIDVAVDSAGRVYVADYGNRVVRRFNDDKTFTVVAQTPPPEHPGVDSGPASVVPDGHGGLFVADNGNDRVLHVNDHQVVTTYAGDGMLGSRGDGGPATEAAIYDPVSIALDASGNLDIADNGGSRIRQVSPAGIITSVIGGGGNHSGDGGPAAKAGIELPAGVAVDSRGDLYVSESDRVREVDPAGKISTVATGLRSPNGLAVDGSGDLFVTESGANEVIEIDTDRHTRVVAGTTLASATRTSTIATDRRLATPAGIAVFQHTLYIAEFGANDVLVVNLTAGTATELGS